MTRELTEAILAEVPEAEVEAVEGDEGEAGNVHQTHLRDNICKIFLYFQTLLKWRSMESLSSRRGNLATTRKGMKLWKSQSGATR